MWISASIIVVCSYFLTLTTAFMSKTDYIKWKEQQFIPKRTASALKVQSNTIYDNLNKVRHHSRFPNLDRVMTKIDKLPYSDTKLGRDVQGNIRHTWNYEKTSTTTTTTRSPNKDDDVFGEYSELNYKDDEKNDSEEETDDWEYEDDVQYEDEDAASPEWQAEEPTEQPTLAPVHRKLSPISEYKWRMYGTRDKVEENRNNGQYNKITSDETLAKLATVHFMRVSVEGVCRKPLPRVIPVQSEHPDPTRSYTPHCTVLYRCAEDTGCCGQRGRHCGPKKQDLIHLYFYTKTIGTLQSQVVKLAFFNHTECSCIEKSHSAEVLETSTDDSTLILKSPYHQTKRPEENMRRCNCPATYTTIFKYRQCVCDCDEGDIDCDRMKAGKEYFSLTDRRCILEEKCSVPTCEFGSYLRLRGRCPRRQEKFDDFDKQNIRNN